MVEFLNSLYASFIEVLSYFQNPGKRVYWLYLLSSLLMMLVLPYFLKKNQLSPWQSLVQSNRWKYWASRSSQLDLKWIFLNQSIALLIFVPVLGGQISWAMSVYRTLVSWLGDGDFLQWSPTVVMALFTVTLFIVEDLSRFLLHWAYHKVPFLWRFHAIHHSAKTMTPLTLYRIHFIEYFLNSLRAVAVIGGVSGVFIYCFVGTIGVYEVLGVSIFNFVFNLVGANLRHSHIWIGFGKFERWFISPAQHQIHHSSAKAHLDRNYGASLAIWDYMLGSWVASKNESVKRYGLFKQANRQRMRKQLFGIK